MPDHCLHHPAAKKTQQTVWALLMLMLSACADPSTSESEKSVDTGLESVSLQDENGFTETYTRLPSTFAKQGEYKKTDSEGHLIELAHYVNDTLHGTRILFYETADTLQIEQYTMGNFEGNYRKYYPGNRLQLTGMYEANTMEGTWQRYYDTGELMEEVTFRDNEENGPFREYYQSGQLKAEGTYLNGDFEHGLLKLYDEEGQLAKTMNCDRGICKTVQTFSRDVQ